MTDYCPESNVPREHCRGCQDALRDLAAQVDAVFTVKVLRRVVKAERKRREKEEGKTQMTTQISPEAESEYRIREAALEYHLNVSAFRARKITADQHRAENRRIRENLTEAEWEQAKFRVVAQMS
jgi:hypothetical protein